MKQILLTFSLSLLIFSCESNSEKDRISDLLKTKIGNELPFKKVKIGNIENGTAVIVDDSWCYWIDKDKNIFCVNGSSKTVYNSVNRPECKNAPIQANFMDIEKIAK